jgi:hypothetical protein
MSKEQLIQQLDFNLSHIVELQVTDKQRLSIAKHIAKMPKAARIEFINALLLIHHKSGNYDHYAANDAIISEESEGSDYDPNEEREQVLSWHAHWNK